MVNIYIDVKSFVIDGKFWVDSLVVWRIYAELRPGSIDWRSLPSQKSKKYNWQYLGNTIDKIWEIQLTISKKYNQQYLRDTLTISEKNNQQYLRNTMTISDKYNWQYLRNTSCKIWEMHFWLHRLLFDYIGCCLETGKRQHPLHQQKRHVQGGTKQPWKLSRNRKTTKSFASAKTSRTGGHQTTLEIV